MDFEKYGRTQNEVWEIFFRKMMISNIRFWLFSRFFGRRSSKKVDLCRCEPGSTLQLVGLTFSKWVLSYFQVFWRKKKMKIEMFRTGWNVQIALLVTQALRNNECQKNSCWSFLSFFADFFVFDITWYIRKLGSFKLSSEIELGQSVPTAYYVVDPSLETFWSRNFEFQPKYRNEVLREEID